VVDIIVSDIQLEDVLGGGQIFSRLIYENLSKYYETTPINIYGKSTAFNHLGTYLIKRKMFDRFKILGLLRRSDFASRIFSFVFLKKKNYSTDILISNSLLDKILIQKIKFKKIIMINHAANTNTGMNLFIKYVKSMKKHATDFRVIALNKIQYKILNKIFPDKVILIYNGIDIKIVNNIQEREYLNSIKVNDKKFILYIGRLEEKQKKVSYVIKAFALLKSGNLNLVIAGKGPDYNMYVSLVKELNIEDKVIFTGFVSDEEKLILFKNCFAFVQPSLSENFSVITLEALSQRAIVLTTKNDGSSDIIKDDVNGFFIEIEENEIKDKIASLLTKNQNTIKTIKDNAYLTAKNFTVSEMIKNYRNLIKEIVEK
jgi:glycosyltransferase involved in cell wall biosynthesis